MKIASLSLENCKRVKTVVLQPNRDGLTVIGGRNGQGKTSILDAITYAFGGERFRPSDLRREGAVGDPIIHIETDDGLVIERKGKNSSLSVTDSTGRRAGQRLLDDAVGKIAINLFRFLESSPREKTDTLLGILGIGNEVRELDREEKAKYDTRLIVGRERDQKRKAAADMETYEGVPDEEVSVSELVRSLRKVQDDNSTRRAAWDRVTECEARLYSLTEQARILAETVNKANEELASLREAAVSLGDEKPTEDIERSIELAEETNAKVRSNREYASKVQEADDLSARYDELTAEIEDVRRRRVELVNGSKLPLVGLSIQDGELVYKGRKFDCWSGAEKMIAGTAIASAENPNCRFVLLDKLEQLDVETLAEFDAYLKEKGLQAIATRVGTGSECTIIIEDGEVSSSEQEEEY